MLLTSISAHVAGWFLYFVVGVNALADTDTITWGGDNSRSGYQVNHNMDPAIVSSADFGQIFKTLLPGNFNNIGPEQIYSQPLVYTGSDGVQYVYVATTQNNIYQLDAKTGSIVKSRNLHVPFLTADLDGCVDINPTIGVTATGVIDPSSGYWYFTAKTYTDDFQGKNFGPSNTPGRLNGRYYFHAIDTATMTEVAGFPRKIDGTIFRNNPNRMFIGGNQHQRPGLLQVGDYIYTGWASHCVQYNYTGAIIGFNKNTGNVVEAFAMEGGPEKNTVPGAGVWMSGGGLAYDGSGSMFFSTGNGYASQLKATGNALQGRNPPTALEEAAVNAKVNDDGTLTVVDFFMPWEKTQLDGADKDLGTSPLQVLPMDVFTCPNHKRIGVVTGKSGKTYWLNLDNLGGYQQGANGLDAAIQVYQNENSVYAGAGALPLGGGYVYINVIQYQTHVFKFSCNAAGNAVFTKVSDTAEKNAFILGVGHGTTTSLKGKEGTGLLWTSDVEGQNLRVYDPIPPSNGGNLTLLRGFNIPGSTKFGRPVFGDGRVYIGTNQGYIYGFGSPVNLPLNCSSPYDFNTTQKDTVSSPRTISCKANVATTVTGVALSGNQNFKIYNVPNLPSQLSAGQNFSFQAAFAPKSVGPLSSDVLVNTTNSIAGYSSSTPITLKGTSNSVAPLLAISPNTMSFNVIAGQGSSTQSLLFSNRGDTLLTFQNVSYSLTSETGPWVTPNVTAGGTQIGAFVLTNVPSTIANNSAVSVDVTYNPQEPGKHAVYLKGFSDGGNSIVDIFGTAGTNPSVLFEFENPDGTGWVTYVPGVPFSFGEVQRGKTQNLRFRITNNGTDTAVPLSITVSKPPYGVPGIVAAVNNVDLAEGTILQVNQSGTATLFCAVPNSQVNIPSYKGSANWTINTGDPNLGKQELRFECAAVAEQVGPRFSNGTAQYGYVGCFRDQTPGRQLATNIASADDMTNEKCIGLCKGAGWMFAGTEYNRECWCGNALPTILDIERDCNFGCTGNSNQTCGGNGYFHNASQISLFADSARFNGNTTIETLHMVLSYGQYGYAGCFQENGAKTFNQQAFDKNNMTVEYCGSLCSSYTLFGLQYSSECYCGSTKAGSSTLVADSQCSMTCKGTNSEYCGAGQRMQVYQLGAGQFSSSSLLSTLTPTSTLLSTASSIPLSSTISSSTPVVSPGTSSGAASNTSSTTSTTTSPALSPTPLGCPSSNNTIYTTTSGAQFVIECFMDHDGGDIGGTLPYTNTLEGCVNSCASLKGCILVAWIPTGGGACYRKKSIGKEGADNGVWGARLALPASSSTTSSSSILLPSSTSSSSAIQDTTPTSSSTSSTSSISSSFSSDTLSSPSSSTALTLPPTTPSSSVFSPISSTVTPSAAPATPTSTSISSTTSFTPKPSTALDLYSYKGCYTEVSGRTLSSRSYKNETSMTPTMCATLCKDYAWFGIEYAYECYCGPYPTAGSTNVSTTECSSSCPGDTSLFCGAGNRLSMYYSNDTSKVSTDPTIPPSSGSYMFYNCVVDSPRVLAVQIANDNMTVDNCVAEAAKRGYGYAGLEFERECWVGAAVQGSLVNATSTRECGMTCKGNARQLCGGSSRLALYQSG